MRNTVCATLMILCAMSANAGTITLEVDDVVEVSSSVDYFHGEWQDYGYTVTATASNGYGVPYFSSINETPPGPNTNSQKVEITAPVGHRFSLNSFEVESTITNFFWAFYGFNPQTYESFQQIATPMDTLIVNFTGTKSNGQIISSVFDPYANSTFVPPSGFNFSLPGMVLTQLDFGRNLHNLVNLEITIGVGGPINYCDQRVLAQLRDDWSVYCEYPVYDSSIIYPVFPERIFLDQAGRNNNVDLVWSSITVNDLASVPAPATLPLLLAAMGIAGGLAIRHK